MPFVHVSNKSSHLTSRNVLLLFFLLRSLSRRRRRRLHLVRSDGGRACVRVYCAYVRVCAQKGGGTKAHTVSFDYIIMRES